jgi:hypothetical protein
MKKVAVFASLFALPFVASAQNFTAFLGTLSYWISLIIPLLISFAVVLFLWGLVKFVMNAEDEGARASGRQLMIWGIIALFVMVAFWGIVGWLQNSLTLNTTTVVGGPSGTTGVLPTP